MEERNSIGWHKLLSGFPWFSCEGCYPIAAYSEYMPPPFLGCKPDGKIDKRILSNDDLYGWKISEIEEEYEIKPGIEHIGHQIMNNIIKLGKGISEHYIEGHGGQNLSNNPYWPADLAARAGSLDHERYVVLLPMMLSRTQDDKGRVVWTFFGNSIHEPEYVFWKSFFTSPGNEIPEKESIAFFTGLITDAYGLSLAGQESLYKAGFRILSSEGSVLPRWTKGFIVKNGSAFHDVKFLLTFRPFSTLPASVRELYFSGSLALLPFPGSLVFWGMPGYLHLKKQLPVAGQIPLQNLVARNRGIGGLRVTQSGWLHEPHANNRNPVINKHLILDTYSRTHRWQKVHRYQDELNEAGHEVRLIKALFSTEPDAMGLYDKPLACNSQLWSHNFELLLNGPKAGKKKMMQVEKTLSEGGLFGYRFFYPPMRAGVHDIYLHRPLVAFIPMRSDNPEIRTGQLYGYITGYHSDDREMTHPLELWPRMERRAHYLSALYDFDTENDHFAHQTSFNIITLFESRMIQGNKLLQRSFALSLLNIAKHRTLEQWLDDLGTHVNPGEHAVAMRRTLEQLVEPDYNTVLPPAITFDETSARSFEESWWNDIRFLAQGEFIYKDNADIMHDDTTLSLVRKEHRDLDMLGEYLLSRYRKLIDDSGMHGRAMAGELPFKWQTLFDFSYFGGWLGNQNGDLYERNLLVIIPGKDHKQAIIFADHYDTAYMEDVFDKGRGGSGARLAARGADDNYSASSTLLQAAPILLKLSREGKLERDIWLVHLTGEEFPSDCMGARNLCQSVVEKKLKLKIEGKADIDLSETEIAGVLVMDMIGHNRDNDQDIFQISPGNSIQSLFLAYQAHLANMIWNESVHKWNRQAERSNLCRGERIREPLVIPAIARHLALKGEVRTRLNPHSSLFNTDGQIFSDTGLPVILFMENYDINRSGYHDTKDTLENIDLDYGAALAAIAIETVARIATVKDIGF